MSIIREINMTKVIKGEGEETTDIVVREYPFSIFINGEEASTLLCSPKNLYYLTLGFLLSEGIIKDKSHIKSMQILEEEGKAIVEILGSVIKDSFSYLYKSRRKTCSGSTMSYNESDWEIKITDNLRVNHKNILSLMDSFSRKSEIFKDTGGVHGAALCTPEEILVFHEDIGRHNAMDKVIGEAFEKDISFKGKLILTSGRISSEMLLKALKRDIPVFVSHAAPMDMALELGKKANMTVIGFVRGERFNIYSGKERITKSNI